MLLVSKHPKEEEVALFMKVIWRKSSCSGEPENEVSGYVRFSKPIVIYLKISSLSQTTQNIYSFEIMNRKRTMNWIMTPTVKMGMMTMMVLMVTMVTMVMIRN